MKKIIFLLGVSFFSLGTDVHATYSVDTALTRLGVKAEDYPQHLVGVEKSETTGDVTDITKYLQRLINGVTAVAATLAVLFLVVNAFNLIIAAGGDNVANAKKGIIWALVGLVVIIGAYVVVKSTISFTYSGEDAPPPASASTSESSE